VADSIAILRRCFPGALVCTTCAGLIASTPAGYAKSKLTPEQVETYVCVECRADAAEAVRKAEAEARKAAIGRANLARVRERANVTTNIPRDAVIHCSGDYTANERLALARHYAKHSPQRLKARRVLVAVPSPTTEGLPACRCRLGCCDICQGRRTDRRPSIPCSTCRRLPRESGDATSPGATEFTCSACLLNVKSPDLGSRSTGLGVRPVTAHEQSLARSRTSRLTGRKIRPWRKDHRSDATKAAAKEALARINAARRKQRADDARMK
jgi:hypothetical protein